VIQVFETLEKLKGLKEFTTQTVGETLGVTLARADSGNPYFRLHEATLANGPFSSVVFQEPGEGAKVREFRVGLAVVPQSGLVQADVVKQYGPGAIYQIMPEAAPEGLITFVYQYPAQKVYFQFTARSYRLLRITICRGPCA
jgi:hypothetical protein